MSILVSIFVFLAIVCEVLFIVGLVSVVYHLLKALGGFNHNHFRRNKWFR